MGKKSTIGRIKTSLYGYLYFGSRALVFWGPGFFVRFLKIIGAAIPLTALMVCGYYVGSLVFPQEAPPPCDCETAIQGCEIAAIQVNEQLSESLFYLHKCSDELQLWEIRANSCAQLLTQVRSQCNN